MNYLLCTVIIGVGATAVTDVWGIVRKRLLGIPALDYGLVGRWLGWMPQGRFRHGSIAAAAPIRHERVIGWGAHYVIGVVFAGMLLGACGLEWVREPTIGPALLFGVATVAAPFLLMQPGTGLGIAARRTPRPRAARIQTVITHTVFGAGLYGAAWIARLIT